MSQGAIEKKILFQHLSNCEVLLYSFRVKTQALVFLRDVNSPTN